MVAQATEQPGGRKRSFRLRPIGCVRTTYRHPEETPTQAPLNPDDMLDRTPVLDVKPWEQHLDVPGWPARRVETIRGGWYQRTRNVGACGLLAGRRSLERAGMLQPRSQEEEVS